LRIALVTERHEDQQLTDPDTDDRQTLKRDLDLGIKLLGFVAFLMFLLAVYLVIAPALHDRLR
jgi:lipopolysaccharide/colanic/teichoic acid biosynthesis glycosyltransferase